MKDTINQALIRSVGEAEHELDVALHFASTFNTSGHESAWR